LNRSSNAFRALFDEALDGPVLLELGDAEGAVLVCRSTVVRGVMRAQALR
jgi:hypothetical protein